MDKGIPDCPDCGGKGMCLNHRVEYLQWVYETARDAYDAALKEYKAKLEQETERNKNEKL